MRGPGGAVGESVTRAVIRVLLLRVSDSTVTPSPKDTVPPPEMKVVVNPEPLRVTAWFVAPAGSAVGLIDVSTGTALTVRQAEHVPVRRSGLVTLTLRAVGFAVGATVTLAVRLVGLLYVTEPTVTPVPVTATVAPLTKLEPPIAICWLVAPSGTVFGETPVTTGGPFTVKPLANVALAPDGSVTVTSRAPGVAVAATVTGTVSCVALVTVTGPVVTPLPEKATVEPATKPLPVTVTTRLLTPRFKLAGLSDVTVTGGGVAVTVKPPVSVALPPPFGLVTVTSRAPGAASGATVRLAVSWEVLFQLTKFTVMPVPEKLRAGGYRNPAPVMVTSWLLAPCTSEFGLSEVTASGLTVWLTAGLVLPVKAVSPL